MVNPYIVHTSLFYHHIPAFGRLLFAQNGWLILGCWLLMGLGVSYGQNPTNPTQRGANKPQQTNGGVESELEKELNPGRVDKRQQIKADSARAAAQRAAAARTDSIKKAVQERTDRAAAARAAAQRAAAARTDSIKRAVQERTDRAAAARAAAQRAAAARTDSIKKAVQERTDRARVSTDSTRAAAQRAAAARTDSAKRAVQERTDRAAQPAQPPALLLEPILPREQYRNAPTELGSVQIRPALLPNVRLLPKLIPSRRQCRNQHLPGGGRPVADSRRPPTLPAPTPADWLLPAPIRSRKPFRTAQTAFGPCVVRVVIQP